MRKSVARTVSAVTVITAAITGCGTAAQSSHGNQNGHGTPVTITLEAPNQWTNSGTSFGSSWTSLIKNYEKANPNVKVNLRVLPLSSFSSTEAAQIAAGTAPEIIFNQFPNQYYELTNLDSFLQQPNPYVPGNKHWISLFKPQFYNDTNYGATGDLTHHYQLPVNLVAVGYYYNENAFKASGISSTPTTWDQFMADLAKLKAHGYIGVGNTNSYLVQDNMFTTISAELLDKYYDKWNWYTAAGKPGKVTGPLPLEDYARAILTKQLTAQTPEIAETLKLLKQVSAYFPPGWSGISDNSGAGVDISQFVQGKVGVIWGVNFGYGTIKSLAPNIDVKSMPLPTVTTATTPLSTNVPARSGASIGGTTYVLPSTDKGAKLNAAINFLQYMTAPKVNQKWLAQSSGNSVIVGSADPKALLGFTAGQWGKSPRVGQLPMIDSQLETTFPQIVDAYLLGSASLSDTENQLEQAWLQAARYEVQQNKNWTGSWTQN